MTVKVPLSQSGPADKFAAELEAHRVALERHRLGNVGIPRPSHLVFDQLVMSVPASGPVAERGPDRFVIVPYEIVDDTPKPPEVDQALKVLRETIK